MILFLNDGSDDDNKYSNTTKENMVALKKEYIKTLLLVFRT
jgi:hypothetical protein